MSDTRCRKVVHPCVHMCDIDIMLKRAQEISLKCECSIKIERDGEMFKLLPVACCIDSDDGNRNRVKRSVSFAFV